MHTVTYGLSPPRGKRRRPRAGRRPRRELDLPKLLLYGSGIYSALTLALHPLSVLKTRAQASTAPSSLSRGDALRAMLRTSGVRGLYAGLGR